MTNYKIEEFKAWLEAKKNDDWRCQKVLRFWEEDYNIKEGKIFRGDEELYFGGTLKFFQEWKEEVDNRERERERERDKIDISILWQVK